MMLQSLQLLLLASVIVSELPITSKKSKVVHLPLSPEVDHAFVRNIINSLKTYAIKNAKDSGNADGYLDKVLVNLQTYLREHYEPFNMGEDGDIKWLRLDGLSTIYRAGSASISKVGNEVILDATLGFQSLMGEAYFEKQIWEVIWLTGTGHATISGLNIHGRLHVDLDNKVKPFVEGLEISNWGQIDVEFTGENWLGQLVEQFADMFPEVIRNWLKSTLPTLMTDGINEILKTVDFDFP